MKRQASKPDHVVKCKTQLSVEGRAMSYATDTNRITMVPLVIRRRQTHKVIMPPPGDPNAVHQYTPDVPMIRTLGKAFYWRRLLNEGKYDTATQLARSLKLEPGWVAEVLRMTLLAPDIIEAIVNGRHPRHINLHSFPMIKLNLPREPHWITLTAGVRLQVRPATTSLVMAARHAASKVAGTDTAAAGERTATLITELAKLAVLAWEGVADDKGKLAAVTPDGVVALMEHWILADAFEREYLAGLYALDAEKNV